MEHMDNEDIKGRIAAHEKQAKWLGLEPDHERIAELKEMLVPEPQDCLELTITEISAQISFIKESPEHRRGFSETAHAIENLEKAISNLRWAIGDANGRKRGIFG